MKMGKEILKFGDIKIKKRNFTAIKVLVFEQMWILRKYQYVIRFPLLKKDYKYFIGCLYAYDNVKQLHIALPKTRAYSQHQYKKRILKAKIKTCIDEVTDFCDKKNS